VKLFKNACWISENIPLGVRVYDYIPSNPTALYKEIPAPPQRIFTHQTKERITVDDW
jgi:hypothetical protein